MMQFLYTNFFQLTLVLLAFILLAVLWVLKVVKSSHDSLIGSIIGSRSIMERFEDRVVTLLKEAYVTNASKADSIFKQLERIEGVIADFIQHNGILSKKIDLIADNNLRYSTTFKGAIDDVLEAVSTLTVAQSADFDTIKGILERLQVVMNEVQQLQINKPTTSELTPLTSEEFKDVMRNFQQLVQKVQAELTISFEKLDRSVAQSFIAGLGKK